MTLSPLWRCEAAFGSNPLDGPGVAVWNEVKSSAGIPLLRKVDSIRRGRQHILGSVEPGHATLTFLGTGGELDPTNTGSIYYPNVNVNKQIRVGVMVNMLDASAAAFTAGPGPVWLAGANTNALAFAANVMTMTATAAGTISASLPAGFRVQPGHTYNFTVLGGSVVTPRTVTWSVQWLDAAGNSLGTVTVTTFTDATGAGTFATGTNLVSPANAAYGVPTYSVAGCVLGEVHKATGIAVLDAAIVGSSTTWRPGGMVPRFTGYIDAVRPVWQGGVLANIEISATDILRIAAQTQLPADPYVARALAAGATALWPLDDLPGSPAARDAGPSGRPAAVVTGTGSSAGFGQTARGASLSATTFTFGTFAQPSPVGGQITFPTAAGISGSGAWCIAAWVKSTDVNDSINLFSQNPPATQDIDFYISPISGACTLVVGPSTLTVSGTKVVNDGAWHMVAAIYTGSAYGIYVDGVLDASTAHAAIAMAPGGIFSFQSLSAFFGQEWISGLAVFANGITGGAAALASLYAAGQYFSTPAKSGTRMVDALSVAGIPAAFYAAPGSGSDAGLSNIQAPAGPPGSLKAYLDTVALAEAGMILARPDGVVVLQDRAHQVNVTPTTTFGDNVAGGERPYRIEPDFGLDNVDLFNASTVQVLGGKPQTWAPGTNVTKYGVQSSLNESGLISAGGDAEALARAQYNVSVNAEPLPRWRSLTCDVLPRLLTLGADLLLGTVVADHSLPPINQAVELGQQVTVNRRSPLTSSVNMIEGMDEAADPERWTLTLHVSPADTQAYWVLGTSQLGVNTRLFW